MKLTAVMQKNLLKKGCVMIFSTHVFAKLLVNEAINKREA